MKVMEHLKKPKDKCPECGAPFVGGLTCPDQLAVILGWEGQDPELFKLHFYTVASFNLQHPAKFTDEALSEMRTIFVQALEGSASLEDLSRKMESRFEGNRRVLKDEAERLPVLREWEVTVADVYGSGPREGASYRVRRWATAVKDSM